MLNSEKPTYCNVVTKGEPVDESDSLVDNKPVVRYEYKGEIYCVDCKNKEIKPESFNGCI